MLGKLLKYDLKELFKLLIPLYFGGLILAVFNGFLLIPAELKTDLSNSAYWSLMLTLVKNMSIMAIASLNLVAFVWCIIRVYNGLFAKEGYLTNTLPVTHHQILASKIISTFLAIFITGVVTTILGFIFIMGYLEEIPWEYVKEAMSYVYDEVPFHFIATISLYLFVTVLSYILMTFVSMALGHLTKARVLLSFVFYFAIQYIIVQPSTGLLMFSVFSTDSDTGSFIYNAGTNAEFFNPISKILWLSIGLYAIFTVISYVLTSYIMNKKLNLQ